MNQLEAIRTKRQEIRETCGKYGATDIRIFGSLARGDFDQNSDIDILIKLDSSNLNGMRYFGVLEELRQDLETLLGFRVDLIDELGLKDPLPSYVLQEAMPI